jgi:succinate dehydrogenase/fumarate reductase flavoprotein subunit
MNSPDAIVIGPGQSGLAAAHSLLARGLRPVVDLAVHIYPATCFVTGTIQNRTVACLSESVISSYLGNHMPSSASCTR